LKHQAKHFFYAAGWKKFEMVWDLLIRTRQLTWATPLLEGVLSRVTGKKAVQANATAEAPQPTLTQISLANVDDGALVTADLTD
jgi:hypothetical protein